MQKWQNILYYILPKVRHFFSGGSFDANVQVLLDLERTIPGSTVCKKQVFDQQFSEKLVSADFGKQLLHILIDKAVMRKCLPQMRRLSHPGPVPTLRHVRGAHKRSAVGGMERSGRSLEETADARRHNDKKRE